MKLIVQIPCHNEAVQLATTLAEIPRRLEGVEEVKILVIDDGSTDGTAELARQQGVEVLRFRCRRGLAQAFKAGIDHALRLGADLIVNTDGDNQYDGGQIADLVAPILEGRADMVIGDRNPGSLQHFSWAKRRLQAIGSWAMRRLSGTSVADSTSGFRAYSREAAMRLNVVTDFTYTLETLIQSGKGRLKIVDVPIVARYTSRTSRLAPTMARYITQASLAMGRAYAHYHPLKVFTVIGLLLTASGSAMGLRFLYYWLGGQGQGHIQSLILSAILLVVGAQVLGLALLADLLAGTRKLTEEVLYRLRRAEAETVVDQDEPRSLAGNDTRSESVVSAGHGKETPNG